MSLERIVITLTKDGKFRGASATDFNDLPVPLTSSEVTAIVPTLNTATMAHVAALEAELATKSAEHARCTSALANVRNGVAALKTAKSEKEKAALFGAITETVDAALLTEDEKKVAALEAQIADANSKLTALRAAKP